MYTSEGKKIVSTDKGPKAIGPYSQAIRTENLVFTAGQIGFDPATMELDNLLDNREPKADTLVLSRERILDLIERIENLWNLILGYACARV